MADMRISVIHDDGTVAEYDVRQVLIPTYDFAKPRISSNGGTLIIEAAEDEESNQEGAP